MKYCKVHKIKMRLLKKKKKVYQCDKCFLQDMGRALQKESTNDSSYTRYVSI